MKEKEISQIAIMIGTILSNPNDTALHADIRKQVLDLTEQFPLYPELTQYL